jgi:hypothetical protein
VGDGVVSAAKTGPVVYFIRCTATKLVKIGFAKNVADRLANLQCGSAAELLLEMTIPARSVDDERAFHKRFAGNRVRGEWFNLTPGDVRAALTENEHDRRLHSAVSEALRAYGLKDRHASDVAGLVVDSRLRTCVRTEERLERIDFLAWAHERLRYQGSDDAEMRPLLEALFLLFAKETKRATLEFAIELTQKRNREGTW